MRFFGAQKWPKMALSGTKCCCMRAKKLEIVVEILIIFAPSKNMKK